MVDSPLSEEGVLGFEYGYSLADPTCLVLWEAQFGDFANGAQVYFDQFIAAGEAKWLRMSGLVCLLPHGYEGQGPEHSSARLERFLQLYADDNIQVLYPSTPASFFHALRRQMHRDFRKPLIVMTPKSLLRHKACTSTPRRHGAGQQLPPRDVREAALAGRREGRPRRAVLGQGLLRSGAAPRRSSGSTRRVALLRLEQLAPFPHEVLAEELARFAKSVEVIWCQEEPQEHGRLELRRAAHRGGARAARHGARRARSMPAGPPRRRPPPARISSICASRAAWSSLALQGDQAAGKQAQESRR